jgi:hypothetical protein
MAPRKPATKAEHAASVKKANSAPKSKAKSRVTGKGGSTVGDKANVTKEQLAASGLSLTGYMNHMKRNGGKRPGPQKRSTTAEDRADTKKTLAEMRLTRVQAANDRKSSQNKDGGEAHMVKRVAQRTKEAATAKAPSKASVDGKRRIDADIAKNKKKNAKLKTLTEQRKTRAAPASSKPAAKQPSTPRAAGARQTGESRNAHIARSGKKQEAWAKDQWAQQPSTEQRKTKAAPASSKPAAKPPSTPRAAGARQTGESRNAHIARSGKKPEEKKGFWARRADKKAAARTAEIAKNKSKQPKGYKS